MALQSSMTQTGYILHGPVISEWCLSMSLKSRDSCDGVFSEKRNWALLSMEEGLHTQLPSMCRRPL